MKPQRFEVSKCIYRPANDTYAEEHWGSKMAYKVQEMTKAPGRSRGDTLNTHTGDSQGEEDKDLDPDPRVMLDRIDTERLKGGQEDKDGSPPMPHGKRQVHEQLVADGLGRVILLDDMINVADGQ